MSQLDIIDPVQYLPEFHFSDDSTGEYIDVNPIEKRKRGSYKCLCRCEEGDLLTTHSQFESHFGREYHKIWRRRFGKVANEEIRRLEEKLSSVEKELKKANVKIDVLQAKCKRSSINSKMNLTMFNLEKKKNKGNEKEELFYDLPID